MRRARHRPLLLLSLAAVLPLAAAGARAAEPLNRIVLRVNDEVATLFDYHDRRDARLETIAAAKGLTTEERRRLANEAGRATMRELFDELLVLSRARQLRLDPTPAQVDAAVDSTRRRMGLDDPAQFEAALAQSGLSLPGFRARMSKNLAFNEVLQREVQSKVKVEDDVVLRLYRDGAERWRTAERRRVEELVVREEAGTAAERAALAAELGTALAGGETMAAAAARLGAERVSGPIDLGWVVRGELAPALDAAVWGLAAGAVSAPVEGRGGLHLLRLAEVDPARLRPFEEVKDEIRSEEGQRRFERATREFLADLERKAYVVDQVPAEAAGFREALPESPESQALGDFAPRREAAPETPRSAPPPAPEAASPPAAATPPPPAPAAAPAR